jgi:transaldolase
MDAFRDHGELRASLLEETEGAERVFSELAEVGVDIDAITAQLQVEGVAAFAASFDQLLGALDEARVTA